MGAYFLSICLLWRTVVTMAATEQITQAVERAQANVPATLRKLRDFYGWTDVDLAARTGIPRTTLASRLRKTHPIAATSPELAAFAAAYGVPVGVLFLEPNEALRWLIDHPGKEENYAKPGYLKTPARAA